MTQPVLADVASTLTTTTPTYDELGSLYRELRDTSGDSDEEMVVQYALAEVVAEIMEYLNLVEDEFEKSVGLTVEQERTRVFEELAGPTANEPVALATDVIERWQSIERVSIMDIRAAFE